MYCLFHSVVYTEFVKPFGGLPLFSSFYLVIFSLYVVITCCEAVRLHPVADKTSDGRRASHRIIIAYVWESHIRMEFCFEI